MTEQVCTTIKSVCYHNRNVCFYLLNKAYSPEWFEALNRQLGMLNSQIIDVKITQEALAEIPLGLAHLTEAALYRLFVSQFIEDKALYLDCDTLVTADLSSLYQIDLRDNFVAAVPDAILNNVPHCYREFPDMKPYFNSGVLLINAKRWREAAVLENALMMLKKFQFLYQDQDLLNILFLKKWLPLAATYNFQTGAELNFQLHHLPADVQKIQEAVPKIIHFTTPNKPWLNGVMCPFRQQYWFYYQLQWQEIIARHSA